MLKLTNILGFLRPAREPSPEDIAAERDRLEKKRRNVLNHAYGFISRGNRAGGVRHVQQYLETEATDAATGIWFFNAMTEWEDPDAALAFGRELIGQLLRDGLKPQARKVLLQCKHLDSGFLPRPEDQIPLAAEPPEAMRP